MKIFPAIGDCSESSGAYAGCNPESGQAYGKIDRRRSECCQCHFGRDETVREGAEGPFVCAPSLAQV